MNKINKLTSILLFLLAIGCGDPDPNMNDTGQNELKSHEINRPLEKYEMAYHDVLYVPIYSDIYVDAQFQKTLLAATLSIRNTSYHDTIFISKIDYFNTNGELVRKYIDSAISVPPMGTINYVIEKEDDAGGSGANFIVEINAKNKSVKPLIQAIMIGEMGNKGFSFSTDAYSILK